LPSGCGLRIASLFNEAPVSCSNQTQCSLRYHHPNWGARKSRGYYRDAFVAEGARAR
jgi:hypothetical protein